MTSFARDRSSGRSQGMLSKAMLRTSGWRVRAFYMLAGGLAIAGLAWIWLLVRAFRQHRRWGLGSLVLPPVGLVFAASPSTQRESHRSFCAC